MPSAQSAQTPSSISLQPSAQTAQAVQAAKSALRTRFRAARAAVPPEENHRLSQQIMQRVIAHAAFLHAATVFLYVSTVGEIETHSLLSDALAQGKQVCVPKCEPKSATFLQAGCMTARRIQSLEELGTGAYGILEPPNDAPLVPPEQIDLVLAPALACDTRGIRLGYGGGYYDRFLCQTPAICAALCPEARLVETLPCEPYDVPCSFIFTERRVLRTDET